MADPVINPLLLKTILGGGGNAPMDTISSTPLTGTISPPEPPALPSAIAAPIAAAPALGSSVLAPSVNSTQTQLDTTERNRLVNTGSGIDQIKNPLLKGLARAGDIAASVFAPNAAAFIPGTSLHHNMLVNQAERNVQKDQAREQATANIAGQQATNKHVAAETNALENPRDKFSPVQTDSGLAAFDPSKGTATPVLGADGTQIGAPTKQVAPHFVTTADGNVVSIAPDASGKLQATTVYEGSPKQETEVTQLQGADGKPHTVLVDKHTGQTVKDLGESGIRPPSVSVSQGTWSLAEDGQGKPVLFNNKTGEVKDAPSGLQKTGTAEKGANGTGTVADKNRTSLAHIAMNNLDHMEDVVRRRGDLLGKGSGIFTNVDQMMGSNDPDVVALGTQIHNFAMANAGIHGSRSAENVRAQEEQLLNHFKTGQKGLLGGIRANRDNLNEVISRTEGSKGNTTSDAPPAGAKVRDYTNLGNK